MIVVSSDFVGEVPLSYDPAKFGVHRPCESVNITFFICHVVTILKCLVILQMEFPHLKLPTG